MKIPISWSIMDALQGLLDKGLYTLQWTCVVLWQQASLIRRFVCYSFSGMYSMKWASVVTMSSWMQTKSGGQPGNPRSFFALHDERMNGTRKIELWKRVSKIDLSVAGSVLPWVDTSQNSLLETLQRPINDVRDFFKPNVLVFFFQEYRLNH